MGKRAVPPSVAVATTLGVQTSIKPFSEKNSRKERRTSLSIRKTASTGGLRRSMNLESSLVSRSAPTLPVGSIGRGDSASLRRSISEGMIS